MSDVSQFNQANLVVAVGYDQGAEALVRFGGDLARRLGKRLVLAHAVEPWLDLPATLNAPEASVLLGAASVTERDALAAGEARLASLAALIPAGVPVERQVVIGQARAAIVDLAAARSACLLIVGASFAALRHAVPRGLSTAMGLMPTTTVPLLVVDPSQPPALATDYKLLVADDLAPATEAAVRYALELGAALGNGTVRHIFVNGIDREQLAAALATASAASHSPVSGEVSPDAVLNGVTAQLQRQLEERAAPYVDYLENAQGRYEAEVVSGGVRSELSLDVTRYHPSVLVFGRHRTLHTGPMFLGRMPYRAMVAYGLPVLIVPGDG